MMINTNMPALNAQRNLYITGLRVDTAIQRLSSGLRINSSADDASAMSMLGNFDTQIAGMNAAVQNTQDTTALFKIADGAITQIAKMLTRMEELAVRASSTSITLSDRADIKDELTQLLDELNSTSEQSEYNTSKILNGKFTVRTDLTIGTGASGSLKVLKAPATIGNTTGLTLSIVTVGSAAFTSGADSAAAGPVNVSDSISINGRDISILATDTVDTVVSKINVVNSTTGVVAVKSATGNGVIGLISGKIDADAANVWGVGSAAANGSAIGYMTTGSAVSITIGGNAQIWSQIGFTGALSGYYASGINAVANLGAIPMYVNGTQGSTLEMTSTGSVAYGIKIGTNLFNGAYGGYIISQPASIASATQNITVAGDNAVIATNNSNVLKVQTGANYRQNASYAISALNSDTIGTGASSKFANLSQIGVDTATDANISLKVIQQAIIDVTNIQANVGASLNRLDYNTKTLQSNITNTTQARSYIQDADIAVEMTNYTKNLLLMQSGIAMLAQANILPQQAMKLFVFGQSE